MTVKTSTPTGFKVGDCVQIAHDVAGKWLGVTFTIERFLKTNVVLNVPGSARGLRAPISCLVAPATHAELSLALGHGAAQPFETPLDMGALVRYGNDLYVVIAQTARGYRIVKLGGAGGRYYTNVPRKLLTLLDASTIDASGVGVSA